MGASTKPKRKTGKGTRKKAAAPRATKTAKLSALGAAAKVLAEAGEPMNARALIDAMATKGYWTSPAGKTPERTLYAAMLREINRKGKDSRFKKAERGRFELVK